MNKLELGQKIRALRKERKQTLETLAEAADIGLVYLGEIERGIKMPSLKTFIKLVNALDVSADELIGLETKSGRDYYTQKLSEQLQVADTGRSRCSAFDFGNDDTASQKFEKRNGLIE